LQGKNWEAPPVDEHFTYHMRRTATNIFSAYGGGTQFSATADAHQSRVPNFI